MKWIVGGLVLATIALVVFLAWGRSTWQEWKDRRAQRLRLDDWASRLRHGNSLPWGADELHRD